MMKIATDHGMVAMFTATKVKLTIQLEASQVEVFRLKMENSAIKTKFKANWQGNRPAKKANNGNYC
jgi:hypothetical protein